MSNDSTIRLVSWTLAGPGTAPIIGDALRSVAPLVGRALVIHTAPLAERDDIDEQASLGFFGDPKWWAPARDGLYVVRSFEWCDDYGAARNAGLDYAADMGADWGMMLDTDERVICPDPAAFRAWLAALPAHVHVVLVHHNDGSHTRERFFRAGMPYRFVGRTHEMLPCPENEQAIAPPELIQWSELGKSREQLRAKFERDASMLREDIIANPRNGAAHYYLGVSLQSLALYAREDAERAIGGDDLRTRNLFLEAIDAYREHRRIDTESGRAWHEGTAFSCYRAAECYLALGEPNRAIDCAAAGLVLDAGIAELYWIAAVASLQEGRLEQARAWALDAKAHAKGSASERRRKGFRIPRGLTTGPDEVLAAVASMMTIEGSVGFVPIVADDADPNAPMIGHDERGGA